MTLTERVEAVYADAQEKGLVFKDAEGKIRPFTKADARAVIDAEDLRNETEFLAGRNVKTSYGSIGRVERAARMCRNPRNKEAEPFLKPAEFSLKVSVNDRFKEKLNAK